MKLSFMFEFRLVPFAFSLILRPPLMLSQPPPPPPPVKYGKGKLFFKIVFKGEANFVLHGGSNDQIMPRRGERVSQNAFSSNLSTVKSSYGDDKLQRG